MTDELHVWHVAVDIAYLMYLALVDVAVRVIYEQVAQSLYSEFLVEKCGLLRSYTLQILYVLA